MLCRVKNAAGAGWRVVTSCRPKGSIAGGTAICCRDYACQEESGHRPLGGSLDVATGWQRGDCWPFWPGKFQEWPCEGQRAREISACRCGGRDVAISGRVGRRCHNRSHVPTRSVGTRSTRNGHRAQSPACQRTARSWVWRRFFTGGLLRPPAWQRVLSFDGARDRRGRKSPRRQASRDEPPARPRYVSIGVRSGSLVQRSGLGRLSGYRGSAPGFLGFTDPRAPGPVPRWSAPPPPQVLRRGF